MKIRTHSSRLRLLVRLALTTTMLLVYLACPTKNYYWDGVLFAQTIEDANSVSDLLHQNHLIYNVIGWCAYKASFGHFRALPILQAMNSGFAAIALWSLFGIIESRLQSIRFALLLCLLFGVAGTWWRFATDADAYIPSVAMLIISTSFLAAEIKSRPLLAAVFHAFAMLIHQLAIFFLPAALFSVWRAHKEDTFVRRSVIIAMYVGTASSITLISYLLGFWLLSGHDHLDPHNFFAWLTTHVPDRDFSLTRNLMASLRSWPQLFFIGRPSLVFYHDPLAVTLLFLSAASLLSTAWLVRLHLPLNLSVQQPRLFQFSLIWLLTYVGFLFFWSPNNTFYKLFALPAIILLIASCWHVPVGQIVRSSLPAIILSVTFLNLALGIIPYSRVDSNEAVAFAMSLRGRVLKPGDLVYFWNLNPDDWFARYFNPGTIWQFADSTSLIDRTLMTGTSVWLETTAIDHFSKSSPGWFLERTSHAEREELVNAKHRIRFIRVVVPQTVGRPAP